MREAHTVAEVRAAEEVVLADTPDGVLMGRAAYGLASALIDFLGGAYGARALLLVGAGNNGGDALFAGVTLLRRGAAVDCILLSPEHTHPDGLRAFLDAGGRQRREPRGAYDVVVDGIVGIGGVGPLRPAAAAIVEALAGTPFVSVDTPSGVEVDSGQVTGAHVRADLTVTFGTHKVAHLVDPGALACGAVHLVDIGLALPPADVEALQPHDVAALLPTPDPRAHKYTRGVVGVRAGSPAYAGAAVLSVAGAGSGLAGMVRFVAAEGAEAIGAIVQSAHPEVVLGAGRVQAWVVGSGAGSTAAAQLAAALADEVPVVIDADALAALPSGPVGVPAVLTPHAGELARMLHVEREEIEADQLRFARAAAVQYDAVVLLKSRHTLIAHPDGRVRVTTVGPPWLATASAGDVLGGLIGALLAAGLEPFDSASVGSWLHGAAAGLTRPGGPLVAGEVAHTIPDLCARLLTSH